MCVCKGVGVIVSAKRNFYFAMSVYFAITIVMSGENLHQSVRESFSKTLFYCALIQSYFTRGQKVAIEASIMHAYSHRVSYTYKW